MHLGLGRASPTPSKAVAYQGLNAPSANLGPQRFNGGMMGPPPGLNGI